ncbi:chalcone isomerase family protein [Herminiimonas fonticola]|uniref:Chalcone isomerase-like protein n=1 Tax=Herminiimonas fonticola TaxID=303380 RepID=A0A4R6GHD1_9BURK|nr:chalcone isomerase family protein [Herminiimonas fonticola]RBA25266.1 Chalcone-flavanone isomerase [Herminiimonas fonticola]TDN94381.1 chalcone isomerase-like protein [Herminiimonas fonticola]
MKPFKAIGGMLAVCCALFFAHAATAVEVAGVKLDDSIKLAGQDLRLNGAGIRTKVIFKVYAIGLYLTDKKTTTADVMAAPGARRVTLAMLRDVGSDEFGKAFSSGIEQNTDAAERAALTAPMAKFNAMFASVAELKQGDVLNLDWVPGSGMVVLLNGKKILEPIADPTFYNAVLRIWLGAKPVDDKLKRQLLGEQ